MPILSILRLFAALVSWAILAAAIYLAWKWSVGTLAVDQDGREMVIREPWMILLALPLVAWTVVGRFFWTTVLAKGGKDQIPSRGDGVMLAGADGAELYVERTAKPGVPTLLFTHGAGNDSTVWHLARGDLVDQFNLVCWDLPGLGKSKADTISLDSYAENLRVVIESIGEPVVIIGHSMGGMTIQTLAKRHPEMWGTNIVGTILLNTTYTNPLKTMVLSSLEPVLKPLVRIVSKLEIALLPIAWLNVWQSYLSGFTHIVMRLTFGDGVTRSQLEHAALLGTRNSPASIARGNLAMIDWDASGSVSYIPGPLLIVAGDGDIVTKPQASATIAGWAIQPELVAIDHANHMSLLDHSTTYNALIGNYARLAFARRSLETRAPNLI